VVAYMTEQLEVAPAASRARVGTAPVSSRDPVAARRRVTYIERYRRLRTERHPPQALSYDNVDIIAGDVWRGADRAPVRPALS